MAKIIGNTTATPNPRPDWSQTDPNRADYIKNKPTSINGKALSGDITLTAQDVGAVTEEDISNKVDKVEGKDLSTNDYTDADKEKLTSIEANANNYTLPIAQNTVLGGVKPATKTDTMTNPVGVDASGQLWTNQGGAPILDENGVLYWG